VARFDPQEAEKLLVACHRRCCICHRWCGSKIELDHIEQATDGGSDAIDNAIAVCFDCHAEAHAYNPRHPRGRKFSATELRAHRDQWLQICAQRPEILTAPSQAADVGPVQALVDELEFNAALAAQVKHGIELLPSLHVDQFKRSIAAGAISALRDELKAVVLEAYGAAERANAAVRKRDAVLSGSAGRSVSGVGYREAENAFYEAGAKALTASTELLAFLGHEG
jgi:hypothetical protein